jgi:deazaflavin-dependent oxidoreductase (nitroreductase family)
MTHDPLRTPFWQRFIMDLAAISPVSWLLSRLLHHLDSFILRITRGRHTATNLLTGLPVAWLTATGAKSGLPRTVPLVALQDGDKYILIATYFGSPRNPSWYHNLVAHPKVLLSVNGDTKPYIACEAQGEERRVYWQQALNRYKGYELYRLRAKGRRIPVMILSPVQDR